MLFCMVVRLFDKGVSFAACPRASVSRAVCCLSLLYSSSTFFLSATSSGRIIHCCSICLPSSWLNSLLPNSFNISAWADPFPFPAIIDCISFNNCSTGILPFCICPNNSPISPFEKPSLDKDKANCPRPLSSKTSLNNAGLACGFCTSAPSSVSSPSCPVRLSCSFAISASALV